MSELYPGDEVTFHEEFLRDIGRGGRWDAAKGIVTEVSPPRVTVRWDLPGLPERVMACNLRKISR